MPIMMIISKLLLLLLISCHAVALSTTSSGNNKIKEELLGLIGGRKQVVDPVLADPATKERLRTSSTGPWIAGKRSGKIVLESSTNQYEGSPDTFINLLEPIPPDNKNNDVSARLQQQVFRQIAPLIPPPLRSTLLNRVDSTYIPMRDLFTSPSVSFAYERGWRQGFAQAGFPGVDREFLMAQEYFAPALTNSSIVVDMSCATGLFTRRFAALDKYQRVLGCDYSESMLMEARRRMQAENLNLKTTQLDWIRLDVGMLPFSTKSIDVLHAGAAMHCWPDLDKGIQEIYRSLKPGGRYFATTFLSSYFRIVGAVSPGGNDDVSQMAFRYFTSVDSLRDLLERNGFESDKINVEVLGSACVVIRCEK
jgi:ubiquinone/menaquinone biosynthesis C-methylase UbiE